MVQYVFVDEPLYVFCHVAFCTDNALSLLEVCSRGAKKKGLVVRSSEKELFKF